MRELRVEDALLYLDQVKVEFGDRPHIYNEFLDIMKTFKTQQIDTPGVIRRVSNLFQGNRRLVLGFNTFLPEGYRIEIPMDGNGPPVAVYRAPGSNVAHILRESAESQAVSVSQQSAAGGGGVGPPQQQHYHPGGMPGGVPHQQQRMLSPQAAMAEHHAAGGGLPYGPSSLNRPQQQQQQQQQAPKPQQHPMLPLNDAGGVVMRPMSQQQQQQQQRPMDVGMGQHQQQLPGGVAPRMMGNSMQQQMMNNNMQQQQQRGKEMMQLQAMQQQQMAMSQPPQMQQVMGPPQMNNVMTADGSAFGVAVETMNASPPVALGGGGGGQPLEFDHAINYVTTIKRRFASEPETYKKFLEILHTYQKEQRGIKEVLDEVSELFEDHPDLLKEFTFFLPDAVQATAKMQLDQAAKESENRKRTKAKAAIMNAAQAMQRQAQQQQTGNIKPSHEIHSDRLVAAPSGGPYQPPTPTSRSSSYERENLISRGARYGTVLFDPVRPPRKQQAVKQHGRPRTVPELPVAPTTTEEAFFQHAKDHLNRKELASDKPSGSRRHTPHSEFLKCLHLFGAGVLSKEELTSLLRVLFLQGHAPKTGVNAGGGYHNPSVANSAAELMREYEEVLIGRGPYADQQDVLKDKSKYGCLRIRDFDLHTATQVSPSYFTYPNDYPHALFLSHPGQTTLDELVLNSKVICVYAGSNEDSVDGGGSARSTSGNGKHHRGQNGIKRKYCPSIEESDGSKQRCNVYEEMMFRIEDERFELDMAIERNAHALRRIEPFAKEAQAFREQEEKDGQPIGRLRYQLHRSSLNTIHINAIARIYGDRGDEILQHLLQNPLIVLPVVYQRLKQKDAEWRNAKNELSERWSSICESNYEGCLDTQCYFNRKALEKSFSSARLLEQCRKARLYVKYPDKIKDHPATRFFAPKFGRSLSQPGALMYQPYMEVQCRVDVSHKYALDLIFQRLKHSPSVTEFVRERIGRVFAEFLVPWFHYPLHWVNMEVRDSFRGKMNPSVTKFVSGQRVCTIFGEGIVASFTDSNSQTSGPKYRVKFSFGLGHLSPAAILYAVQSSDSLFVRRDGIMVRDESSYYSSDRNPKLDMNHQILFATERTYQFLRLYLILCSMIADTREYVTKVPQLDDPADFYITKTNGASSEKRKTVKLDYTSVLVSLRKVLKNDMNEREFETLARKISRDKVHEIATLPVLVDRCLESLLNVVEEDTLLLLFDYCHVNIVDPLAAQSHCLAVAPDAFYRVQLDASDACIRFCYLEGSPLLTSPPDDIGDAYIGASSYGVDMDDEDMNNGMDIGDDDAIEDEALIDDVIAPPESKRSKLFV